MGSVEELLHKVVTNQAIQNEQMRGLREDVQEMKGTSIANGLKRVEALEEEADKSRTHRTGLSAILAALLALLPFSDKIATFFGIK